MRRGMRRAGRITDREFAAVVREFVASAEVWDKYAPATKDVWGRELRLIARQDTLGGISIYELRPSLVQAYIDGLSGRPGKQAAALAVLRRLELWAIVRDKIPYPITMGVTRQKSDGGHTPWEDDQVALVERYARPEIARVVTLAGNTGQRGSDLVRMRWTDIEVYNGRAGINVTQQKTGKRMWVPITRELSSAMDTWEKLPGPILRRPTGIAWDRKSLTGAWATERDTNKKLSSLAGLTLHGLRATACVRLLRAGANTRQIADMVGMSEPIVARYVRFAQQKDNASAAVLLLDRARTDKEHATPLLRVSNNTAKD